MDFNRERELRRFNDIRKALKENNEKLKKCTLHDFDVENFKFGQKIKCKKCGAEVPPQYYKGYEDLKEKLRVEEGLITFMEKFLIDDTMAEFQKEFMRRLFKKEIKEGALIINDLTKEEKDAIIRFLDASRGGRND